MNDCHDYDDIISLPHHISSKHPRMPLIDRAAQFSPFAALTGLGAALDETARLTDARIELSEERKEEINLALRRLQEQIASGEAPRVKITCFCPDDKKSGGAYRTVAGVVKKVDEFEKMLILRDGERIPFWDIALID